MNSDIEITNAKYVAKLDGTVIGISCVFGSETVVAPISSGNRHYDEIMRQVAAGTLTIADAE
jgi:hypothetical protein